MNKEDLNVDRLVPKHATASLFLIYEGKLCLVYPMVRNAYMIEENNTDFIITVSKNKKVMYDKIKIESLGREHEINEVDFIKTKVDINDIIIDEPKKVSVFLDKTREEVIDILGKTYNVMLNNMVHSNYFSLNMVATAIENIVKRTENVENKLDDEEFLIYEIYINEIKKIEARILEDYMATGIINFDLIKIFYTYLLVTEPYNIKLFESSLNTIKEYITETTN